MLKQTCEQFVEKSASKSPTPGGGSVCAYVGSLGMALGNMVGNLTTGKKKYAEYEEDIQRILKDGEAIMAELNNLVNEDAKAFEPLAKAYSMKKETEEEKKLKHETMQSALIEAVEVPLKIAQACCKAIDLHEELEKKGTVIAISDVGVGVLLCKAALQGAKLNININTSIMDDTIFRDCVLATIKELMEEYIKKADEIYEKVAARVE